MLTITAAATAAVDAVIESNGLPEEAGLRLACGERTEQGTPIVLSVAEERIEGDEVVATGGAHDVYLDPEAAEMLDDKELDAEISDQEVAFTVKPQASPNGTIDAA